MVSSNSSPPPEVALEAPTWLKMLLGALIAATLWLFFFGMPTLSGDAGSGAGRPLPSFKLATLDGGYLIPEDLRGRVTVLNFFATWCGPCRAEMPELVRFSEGAGEGVAVVGIGAGNEEAAEMGPFLERYHVPYRVAVGGEELMFSLGGQALPTTVIVDARGQVVRMYEGPVTEGMLKEGVAYARGGS